MLFPFPSPRHLRNDSEKKKIQKVLKSVSSNSKIKVVKDVKYTKKKTQKINKTKLNHKQVSQSEILIKPNLMFMFV